MMKAVAGEESVQLITERTALWFSTSLLGTAVRARSVLHGSPARQLRKHHCRLLEVWNDFSFPVCRSSV